VDADLEQLGSTEFQDLAATLAVAAFGPGLTVMGRGRDGGRDFYYNGQLQWGVAEQWAGYTVFQVKQKERLSADPADDTAWMWTEVRKELNAWCKTDKNTRKPLPDQLVFVTNVRLTPYPTSGGHDKIRTNIDGYIDALRDTKRDINGVARQQREAKLARLARIKRFEFWDRSQLFTLLNLHQGVRRAFKGFLTPGDVLEALKAATDRLTTDELEPGLRAHARSMLTSEGLVRFAEAGHAGGPSVQVYEVAIDLPVVAVGAETDSEPAAERESVVGTVLARAERMLKPSMTRHQGPRHLIITGDPGNGKTTISRLLTQAYRSAFIGAGANLSAEHQRIIDGTSEAMVRLGQRLPGHRRWPIRIDLAEYAAERGNLIEDSMMRWIATKVSMRSNVGAISPAAMVSWQQQWPCLVVFDGLDEVTEPSVRHTVIDRVVDFVNEAEAQDCDLLAVLTTRPTGYTENISPAQFDTIALADLTPDAAVEYGKRVTRIRIGENVEQYDSVVRQLVRAADDESLRPLLRTPLQVLILSIIIENSAGNLAPDRFSLFYGYYDTVYKRELAKQTTLANILRDHPTQIQQLHERVGAQLQLRSQVGDRAVAALTPDELETIATEVLTEAGHKIGAGDSLLDDIVKAARQRLVLLSPKGPDGLGFDVRSLQELMAAMYLTSGDWSRVSSGLTVIAASPHWRNTWIFAAGYIFRNQRHLQGDLIDLIDRVDDHAPGRLGHVVPVGPRLALDLLDDGMARAWPRWWKPLLDQGFKTLDEAPSSDLRNVTRALIRFADSGAEQKTAVADMMRARLAGPSPTRAAVERMKGSIPSVEAQLQVRTRTRGLFAVKKNPGVPYADDPVPDWDAYDEEIATTPGDATLLQSLAVVAQRIRDGHAMTILGSIRDLLEQPAAAAALEAALTHVIKSKPALQTVLRDHVLPDVYRKPVTPEDLPPAPAD